MANSKKVMTAQEFANYINSRATTSEILTAAEVAHYRRSYYRPGSLLTKAFAEEIIQRWNSIDVEEDGDPYGILGCNTR
jgi:hypothetical protein